MKTLCTLVSLLALATLAQAGTATPVDPAMQSQMTRQLEQLPITKQVEKPNEIKGKNTSYSGILVQLVKTDNPLQLVNPFAPARYGSGQDNLVRSPLTGRATGLKFLSFSF